jgi:aspartyl-tRNA(Asn)/glutamyl-tRNA(Gln) amidotransferase subunit A
MTIQEAAAALRARQVSSVELTEQSIALTERLNPELNAFLTVTVAKARERALQADQELSRGVDRGPLHGIPIAHKDLFYTKTVRTTAGSLLFVKQFPTYDAAVVEKLNEAGAVMIGKTGMHELAYGVTSDNPHFGSIANPWNVACIPGGSSGGSGAAVASGMVAMAMGSDTGGSIRIPASFCGTVGLKPTFGRVSRYGAMPLGFSLDHMGPLTRTVRDAALTLQAIAGHDPRDPSSSRAPVSDYMPPEHIRLAGVRIGLPENFYFDRVDPEVRDAVQRAARLAAEAGAEIVPLRVPDIDALNTLARVVLLSEASALYERYMDERDLFGRDVLALLDQGRLIKATDYVNAQRLRRSLAREFSAVWTRVDCLFTPTTSVVAPRIGQATVTVDGVDEDVRLAATRFVRAINLLGVPAISLPCGMHSSGLPMGLQIVGRAFQEPALLRVAAAVEDALGSFPLPATMNS